MITSNSVVRLARETLSNITCYYEITLSDAHLVGLTMGMEDGEFINNTNPERHGLIRWSYDEFATFLNERVKIDMKLCQDINNIALVNVHEDGMNDLFDALAYNMAFQIIMTWAFYYKFMSEMPRDIEDVQEAYFSVWPNAKRNKRKAESLIREWTVR